MRNWIERVIRRFKTTRHRTTSSPTGSLMPYLALFVHWTSFSCRLEQQGQPKLMGLTGVMSDRCIADNKRVHRAP